MKSTLVNRALLKEAVWKFSPSFVCQGWEEHTFRSFILKIFGLQGWYLLQTTFTFLVIIRANYICILFEFIIHYYLVNVIIRRLLPNSGMWWMLFHCETSLNRPICSGISGQTWCPGLKNRPLRSLLKCIMKRVLRCLYACGKVVFEV